MKMCFSPGSCAEDTFSCWEEPKCWPLSMGLTLARGCVYVGEDHTLL